MLSFLKQHALALLWSFLLHAALAAVLTVSLVRDRPFPDTPPAQLALQATVVDSGRIEEEMRQLEAAEQQETRALEAEAERLQEEAEQARRAQEEEERRLRELREQRETEQAAEQQRQQQLAEQREAEAEAERRREAELEAQQMAEALREREEAQKRQEELRRQQEAERERLEELERRRKEEEARLARLEEERRAAEEARRKAAAEAALRSEIEAEQQLAALQNSPQAAQYKALLRQHIQRQWIRPPSAQPGIECTVHVTQIPSGDVVDVRVGTCNGDEAVRRSIEAAVYRASPLPRAPVPELAERNIEILFRPES